MLLIIFVIVLSRCIQSDNIAHFGIYSCNISFFRVDWTFNASIINYFSRC